MYKGGAGGYTFYVRGGEQVIRQRKNNSNYGETASRTRAQMIRRIRWGNLVNCYKAISSWQKKAYDSKVAGQTDYNIFMQLNINRCTVGETKEMCEGGCAVFEGYQVSRGSLAPITLSYDSQVPQWLSGINLTAAITSSTTIGQLSADIIANNPEFLAGDNIAIIIIRNYEAPRVEWPFASSVYAELTLDASNTALLSSIPIVGERLEIDATDKLSLLVAQAADDNPLHEVGAVMIHTRKSASYLKVSSQSIVLADQTIVNHFSGSAWDETCINSYGIDQNAPLEPSFKGAVIADVAINGSSVPLIYGRTLVYEQPVTLVITGDGMNSDSVYLEHDGVRYTPLVVDGNSWTYVLSENGTNKIFVNGSFYGGVAIRGVTPPSILPRNLGTGQTALSEPPISGGDMVNRMSYDNSSCANYPFLVNGDAPNFLIGFGVVEGSPGEFVGHNCTIVFNGENQGTLTVLLSVTDPNKAAWLTLDGFIVFVFNYTA